MNILISETWVDATGGYIIGDSGVYETMFGNIGELFKSLKKKYGKCISKMFIGDNENAKHIGWVFSKKVKYEDCNKYFTQETWVSLHEKKPETIINNFYKEVG